MRLSELADRVEALTGPRKETDALVECAFPPQSSFPGATFRPDPDTPGYVLTSSSGSFRSERYTASLDAVVALASRVLPGRVWQLWTRPDGTAFAVFETSQPGNRFTDRIDAATPALALLSALLRAAAQTEGAG